MKGFGHLVMSGPHGAFRGRLCVGAAACGRWRQTGQAWFSNDNAALATVILEGSSFYDVKDRARSSQRRLISKVVYSIHVTVLF